MGDLRCERTNDREPLRLQFRALQPSALFHFRPQRGGSTLDRLLQQLVRIAKCCQQPNDNKKEANSMRAFQTGITGWV
jgi:hypothetical protein